VNDKTLDSQIYPNSLVNMREQLSTFVGSVNDVDKLPLWMTSQQLDGSTTGYIPAWVLCYTKPGKSEAILKHLNTFLVEDNVNMNSINFAMDRFEVDRSMSFTWGTTTDDSWPTIKATMSTSLGQNISVSSLTGIEINQPIRFTNGANTANVLTDNTYYVSEINPNFEYQTQASRPDGSTFAQTSTTQTIKVRNSYYGTSVDILTPGGDTLMDVQLLPTSAFSNDDTEDTYIVFEQETILKK
jgi:hypothetical protein